MILSGQWNLILGGLGVQSVTQAIAEEVQGKQRQGKKDTRQDEQLWVCLLYTSDAADE